jgi:hypothetical protein
LQAYLPDQPILTLTEFISGQGEYEDNNYYDDDGAHEADGEVDEDILDSIDA